MMKIHTLPMGPVQANCYVVIDEHSGEAAVIDPVDYTDELKSVLRDEVKNLKYILLTHGHYDHILGVAHIKDDYPDAKIAIHPYDSACLKCEDISLATHVDHGIQKYVDYDLLAEEGFEAKIGDITLHTIHTPGHTLGGVCYLEGTERVMFSGDTLFCRTVGRTDLPGGDWQAMVESLKRLAALDGEYTVYTGHNRSTTLSEERVRNRYLRKIPRGEL